MSNNHIQSLYCVWNSVQIWGLVHDNVIVHLSFDRDHHKAVCGAQETGAICKDVQREICAFLLSTLQGTTHAFPSESPFIRRGTPFQQRVWHALCHIPCATTKTYGEIARELGNPHLARAVGQACNRNPLPLIIPCHRVVGSSGLGGFAGGIQVKKKLLEYEQAWGGRADEKLRNKKAVTSVGR